LVSVLGDRLRQGRRLLEAELTARRAGNATRRARSRERAFRKEFAQEAARLTPYLGVEHKTARFVVPVRQKFGVGRFAWTNWKEDRHLERAAALLRKAGIEVSGTGFVDVGANVGTTTVLAQTELGFAGGWALEPEPENFRLLRANLALNGLEETVQAFQVAASDHDGRGFLSLRPTIGSKHHIVEGGDGDEEIEVPLVTLDSMVEEGVLDPESVGLLWLDVEGHELEVLEGASALLGRPVPLVMEFDPRILDRARIDRLRAILSPRYDSVIDLRTATREGAEILTPGSLESIAARYPHVYTDLLAYRTPDRPPEGPTPAG
jgi:FkbM family methyltransferase